MILQLSRNWVAVMFCHSEYVCAFIFLLLIFEFISAYVKVPTCLWNPSIVAHFCCTAVSKAAGLKDEGPSTHPT